MDAFYEEIRDKIDAYVSNFMKFYNASSINIYFRGHGRDNWPLIPTIKRRDTRVSESESIQKAIIQGCWCSDSSLFENIAHMQHYGFPTRFLDYTTEADIALFFVCNDPTHYDSNGKLFICMYDERNAQHVDTRLISELSLLEQEITIQNFSAHLLEKYEDLGEKYLDTSDLGINILSWIDHGFMVTPSDSELDKLKIWNCRLFNQRGTFFVFGNKLKVPHFPRSTSWTNTHTILPEIADAPPIIQHQDYIGQIMIPRDAKPDILKSLAKRGINMKFIFPD